MMADAAVTFLLENVSKLLTSSIDLIAGAEDELRKLKCDLSLLKALLDDAAKVEKNKESFREIERQIREAVYDAEDTLDSCLTQAAATKGSGKGRVRMLFNQKSIRLETNVKSIRENRVVPVIERVRMEFANMKIGDGPAKIVEPRRMRAPAIREENIVGFDDEEKTLLEYLMDSKEELDVISIIGMAGLGKTTLAWKIYQNQDIQYEFPICIWVYVSQKFNRRELFVNIIKKFTSVDMSSLTDLELGLQVHEFLKTGKFLLVMDDVWTVDAWDVIRDFLPKSNTGSKVLITSCDSNVGKHANPSRAPHYLRFLRVDESWELLQYEVFGKLDICPKELEGIGKHIAKQCDGLPLAIVVVGGILVDHFPRSGNDEIETKNKWMDVSNNVSMHVQNNISEIIAWSYNTLPGDLRDCFLYLGMFPEDYEIPAWTLTCLWIAEGFVRQKEGQSLEDTAEENLKDLINRNLVMIEKTNPIGQIKTCRVHDVIRAFCISKAAEQNLFQEIKMSSNGTFDPPPVDIKKYRRLCIHSYLSRFFSEEPNGPNVRSFLCFNKQSSYCLENNYLTAIPDAFGLLRVLDFKSIRFSQFPLKVTKLIHLRYITLRCDDLDYLHESISSLWNLQTLVVETKSHFLKVKANIWKMIQLRHLKTKAAIVLAIKEEGQATGENLQTLCRLSPEYCTEEVFQRAPYLKRLGIRGQLATLVDAKSLTKLVHLEKLKLVYDLVNKPLFENRLHCLPQPNCFPPNLQRLTLSATYLDWKHMSTLGKIETLRVLKLKDSAFIGKSWDTTPSGSNFGSLQFLLIENTDLVSWDASTDHFPSLRSLVLKNCEQLNTIPWHLVKNLQILEIERVTVSFVQSALKIKEEIDLKQGQQKDRRGGLLKLIIGPGCW